MVVVVVVVVLVGFFSLKVSSGKREHNDVDSFMSSIFQSCARVQAAGSEAAHTSRNGLKYILKKLKVWGSLS